jgi:tight adherence protein C
VLLGFSTFMMGLLLAGVPVPPAPRLGHRGAARYKALEANGIFTVAEPIIRFMSGLIGRLPLGEFRARQDLELKRAGNLLGVTADEFVALSLLSALALGGTFATLARFAGSQSSLFFPGVVLGLILPKLQVRGAIRERLKTVTRGLPHSIEIAALCMGAGLDFPGALRMLVKANPIEGDPLAEEFANILEELELGHTRKQALLGFANRVPTPAVRDFVNAVVQAEQKGNPLAKVIQGQGRMLNMRRSVAAEEAAARAGVLMIGPMVLLLGTIMLFLMGPFMVKGIGF